jgi:hypothetical protein
MTEALQTVYAQNGNMFFPTVDRSPLLYKSLPIGTYLVGVDMKMGFYVELIPDFTMPRKIYGEIKGRSERIIETFHDRPNSTGVILSGEKGSGKTLLTKKLSIDLAKQNVITLVVNQAFSGDAFNQFIAGIHQPAYVLFDEYEKVYNREEDQNALLTLFDGLFSSKKLFAVTTNERGRMNSYMINRPGRFFYAFEYKGLDEAFIREFLADNLYNQDHLESFVRYASTYEAFNFDMLQALVEEMNRYNEGVTEAAKWVNVSQSWTAKKVYKVLRYEWKNKPEGFQRIDNQINGGSGLNPFIHTMYMYYHYTAIDEDDNNKPYDDSDAIVFQPNHIKSFGSGKYVYENEDAIVEIVEDIKERFDYESLI